MPARRPMSRARRWRYVQMLQVWLLDRPEGRFATHMMITPEIEARLEQQPTTP